MAWKVGTNKSDVISGTSYADRISGLSGNDLIYGNGGDDEISGDGGNDTIWGGSGNDRIVGGTGDDILIGGAGRDTLWGCSGADVFVYTAVSDSPVSAKDYIKDFDFHDTIDLSALGAFAGGFIGTASFSGAGQGEVRFVSLGVSRGTIEADVNGDGVADLAIDIFGVGVPVTASDFVL
jgi:Ca2+-binding RTX toxin-like protein